MDDKPDLPYLDKIIDQRFDEEEIDEEIDEEGTIKYRYVNVVECGENPIYDYEVEDYFTVTETLVRFETYSTYRYPSGLFAIYEECKKAMEKERIESSKELYTDSFYLIEKVVVEKGKVEVLNIVEDI